MKKKKRMDKKKITQILALIMAVLLITGTIYTAIVSLSESEHDHTHEYETVTDGHDHSEEDHVHTEDEHADDEQLADDHADHDHSEDEAADDHDHAEDEAADEATPAPESTQQASANARYAMGITVNAEQTALEVEQTIAYTNNGERTLDSVLFHLYGNMYRRLETVPLSSGADAFPDGYAPGGLNLLSVTVNGKEALWGVSGDGEQYLRVTASLMPGESAVFGFSYQVLLPLCEGRLGAGDLTWRLTGFYPSAAVWDASLDDFALSLFSGVADSLYEPLSDYDVTVNAPDNWLVAAGGSTEKEASQNGRSTWRIQLTDARSFGLALTRKLTLYERKASSGVQIAAYANTTSGARAALDAAASALSVFEEWFGEYPFGQLSLVQSDMDGRSDYASGLILLPQELFSLGQEDALRQEVARQVAAQYFGCLVGSNATLEPWLSESLPVYAQLLYIDATEGRNAYLKALNRLSLDSINITIAGGLSMDSARARYDSRTKYEQVVIERGQVVLHELRSAMGEEVFLDALCLYVRQMRGQNASIENFAACLNQASGGRWDEYLVGQMHNISDYVEDGLTWIE